MLAADVMLVTDGGGEVNALPEPMFGRAPVLRLLSKLYEAKRSVFTMKLVTLNGEPAIFDRPQQGEASGGILYHALCLELTAPNAAASFCVCAKQTLSLAARWLTINTTTARRSFDLSNGFGNLSVRVCLTNPMNRHP